VQGVWGFDTLRPMQSAAIAAGIEGRDCLTVLPTGGGKSLCYQVPPLVTGRTTVVISPLIALMRDQVRALELNDYPAAALHSALDHDESRAVFERLDAGELRLLLVAPERAMTSGFGTTIATLHDRGTAQLDRDRRGALHQPVGARLPPRVPDAAPPARDRAGGEHAGVHRDRDPARARRHRPAAGPERPRGAGRHLRPPQPDLPRARQEQGGGPAQRRDHADARPGRGRGDRLLPEPGGDGGPRREAPRQGARRGGVPRGARPARAARRRGAVHQRGTRHRRRDGRVRDGDRPLERAAGRAREHAQVDRGVPAGDGSRRARRDARGVPAALQPLGRGEMGAARAPVRRGGERRRGIAARPRSR
jgi:hypothetical protein